MADRHAEIMRTFHTELLTVDAAQPPAEILAQAARILRAGGLVAFPTETVYGLGATLPHAVRIFTAKGRPPSNPLIVHVADVSDVLPLVTHWPQHAQALAWEFWPGPLTLVLPRSSLVPDSVTAGGVTVAVRVPAHPVARALLLAIGEPVAAPSANRSEELSPTRAEHVLQSLAGRIDLVLDAGPTSGGIESTVVDVSGVRPRLLRPGLISLDELETIVGIVDVPLLSSLRQATSIPAQSPGQHARHYAPRTALQAVEGEGTAQVLDLLKEGKRIGWLTFGKKRDQLSHPRLIVSTLPTDSHASAARLYAALHEMDAAACDVLLIEMPPDTPAWMALRDRIRRAATPK